MSGNERPVLHLLVVVMTATLLVFLLSLGVALFGRGTGFVVPYIFGAAFVMALFCFVVLRGVSYER